uniref:Anthocyanin 5-aromatic acyltransferase n=1 Tax=Aegilops tauschii TaxID=37682 RepID=N1R3U1_AEGTA
MRFAVSKSPPVMVRPSTEPVPVPGKTTATQVVQLASWDTTYVDFQVTVLLVFDGSVHQPVEAIKKGLSRALAHYHTIAGRLAATAHGDGVLLDAARTGEPDASAVPSITPVRDGRAASLPLLSAPVVAAKQSLMLDLGGQGLIYLDTVVPMKLIDRIKSDYKAAHSGYCTTFEATAAVLWRCRTRAIIGDDPDGYDMSTPAPLAFFVNVRKHVGTAAGYYGNCAVAQLAFATTGEVAGAGDEGMNGLVDLIKRAKDGVPELLRGMRAGGSAVDGMGEEEIAAAFGDNALMVTCWRTIRFDAADFGGGGPARVVGRWQQTTLPCVALVSCGATGERLLTQCVRAEHAAALLAELDQRTRLA